ncbi:MAG: chondroitinase family polysaccharide lyase, partial [Armatimonadota bacterium]
MYRSMICTLAALVANIIIAAPISFEQQDATLKWSVTGDGQVQVTTAKSKDGERSLAWEWHDGGSLTFTDAEVLKEAGGFSTWIYTSRPMDQTIRVRFGPTGSTIAENVPYAFDYPLSFRGWRYCTVGFDEDIPVEDFAGDSTVTEMTIEAPAGTSGRVMFDLMEFPPHVLWSRGADRQLPFINPRREYDWFIHFDDRAQEAAPTHPAAGAEIEDIERIERRYHSWLTGAGADWSDPLVRSRLDEFLQKAQEAKDRLEDLTNRPLVKLGDFRTVFGDLGILAVACNTDAPDNPFYDADDIREMILAAFRHVHEQGFAEGSLFGDARVFRLMTGGYEAAVFLMRDELAAAGMLQTQLNAMRWYSCIGRVFVETDNRGMNADVIRGRYLMCLAYVLSLPDANRQAMWMRHLSPWMSRGLLPAPETSDTIKPDYTGFHHGMIVGNSYVINALHAGSTTQYLLDDTTFSLSPPATDSLRKALLAARWYANKYDVPTMLALRWPFITGSLYQLIPAYAYQALTDADGQMAGVFARLWDPSVSEMAEKSLGMGPIGFCYMGTMGAVDAVQKAAERAVPAEPNPEGFRFFPYGALAVHRRGDWMVATKGWSKYIKNYEQQQYRDGRSGRNIHGRYTSHGTTEIYSAGEPVSPRASGYVEDGWDWNRWPGSTAIYLPWDELYEKGPYGRQVNEETFVGAVEHNGKSGMFAMQLSDPHHAPGFFARKSYLYVDDMIVCLGSNIASDDTQHPVETT